MPHRVVERLGGLAGKRASRGVGDRAGDDDGQPHAAALESLLNGKERRLGIERIEHRFQEEQVDAALEQPVERFVVGRDELIEADRAKARIVDIGRDRCGLVGRPEHASHETRPLRRLGLPFAHGVARELGGGAVELACKRLHAVVGKRHRSRVEGVGLDDVGARLQVLSMDVAHEPRLRERKQIVMATQLAWPVPKARAAVILFGEPRALDHRAHRAVEQHDALS